ncbi:MAG: glycosyltransferase [Patescibacteria group bacterium]|jgi:glycosyltransferase involved in cell wall biosynthesis
MKLLIIAPYFYEPHRWMISAYKTALNLAKQCEVVVLTTGQPRFEQIGEHIKIYRMVDWFLPDPVNYSIVPNLAWNLWRVVKKEKPDVYLVNKHMFFTSFSVILLRIMGKKVILATDTFPGINWHPRKKIVSIIMTIYAWLIGWPILKLSNLVILYHEGLVGIAKKLKIRFKVIHNGVDLETLVAAKLPTDIIKHINQINICYIGRLESIKGYKDIIDVAKQITFKYPQVKFYFIGSYLGKEEMVKNIINEKIIFLGHREDIYSLLKIMDIFVLSSYSEGLPNALMEAMASGIACVASDVGGVKILIQNGVNGLSFKPGDQKELIQKLSSLVENPELRQKLALAGRKKIIQEFDWNKISDQYMNLFKEVYNNY